MRRWVLMISASALIGCPSDPTPVDAGPQPTMTRAEILDPLTCKECHPNHYREWSGSMHAYAAEDPVFIAMNQRGQRETNGELGDFCVTCHAPIALLEGLTSDGLNLDQVPDYAKGVTCAFCHLVDEVQGTHNGQLGLADDLVMRGAYADPTPNTAHASAYSKLHDKSQIESADVCGTCHDIVTQQGVHLERTFLEWKSSLFAHDVDEERQTCGDCHMKGRTATAADAPGVKLRRVHDHRMVGVDTALTDFPEKEDQRRQIQRELNTTAIGMLCVTLEEGVVVLGADLENMAAGHSWPSGASHDRRAWVEVVAYDAQGNELFSSGVIGDRETLVDLNDPQLWRLGDQAYDAQGEPAHFFWDVASYESLLLPPPNHLHRDGEVTEVNPHLQHEYRFTATELPARVTFKTRIRAIGLDVLDDLIESGDLAADIRNRIPTFDLGATILEWSAEDEITCIPENHHRR